MNEKKLFNSLGLAQEVNTGYVKRVGINDDIYSFSCHQPQLTVFNFVCARWCSTSLLTRQKSYKGMFQMGNKRGQGEEEMADHHCRAK